MIREYNNNSIESSLWDIWVFLESIKIFQNKENSLNLLFSFSWVWYLVFVRFVMISQKKLSVPSLRALMVCSRKKWRLYSSVIDWLICDCASKSTQLVPIIFGRFADHLLIFEPISSHLMEIQRSNSWNWFIGLLSQNPFEDVLTK